MRKVQTIQQSTTNTVKPQSMHRSWMPATQSSVAPVALMTLNPAHWSRQQQQTSSWTLIEFLNARHPLH